MKNKLYVGNLSFNVTEQEILDLFGEMGTVTSCKLITDQQTGRPKGFAFIEMETEEAAQNAISNLDGSQFLNRELKVNEAKPQGSRPPRKREW